MHHQKSHLVEFKKYLRTLNEANDPMLRESQMTEIRQAVVDYLENQGSDDFRLFMTSIREDPEEQTQEPIDEEKEAFLSSKS